MKSTAIKLATAFCAGLLFAGCYTQLAVTRQAPPTPPSQPCPDSLSDSCGQAPAVLKDTVIIRDNRREVCYWSRNWMGQPVLRCYDTYYSDGWVSYNSDPWWHSRYDDTYLYGYSRCPSYYYYDPYTGYCRYRDDYNHYYPGSSGGSGGGGGSTSTADRPPRRSIAPREASEGPAVLPKATEDRPELKPYAPSGGSDYRSSQPSQGAAPEPRRRSVSPAPSTAPAPVITKTPAAVAPAPAPAPAPAQSGAEGRATSGPSGAKSKQTEQSPAPAPAQPAEGSAGGYAPDKKK